MSESLLLEKIEDCRKEMITLSDLYGMTSEVVIQTSKKLDILLNEYQGTSANYKDMIKTSLVN